VIRGRGGEGISPPSCSPSHSISAEPHHTQHHKIPAGQQGVAWHNVGFLPTIAFPHQPITFTKSAGWRSSPAALQRGQPLWRGTEYAHILKAPSPLDQSSTETGVPKSKYGSQNGVLYSISVASKSR